MQHFFVVPDQVRDGYIEITGSDVNHMKNVLRMKTGEQLEISDGNNKKYLCEIESLEADKVTARILEEREAENELPSKLYLFQGLPKSDKMELIIQKVVELGAWEVIPVATKRAVVKLDQKKAAKKRERWSGISESAAKQAGRNVIPEIKQVMNFQEALSYAKSLDVLLIPYELAEGMQATKERIQAIQPGQSVGIFIGPEGGFEQEEVKLAMEAGAYPITLGRRILRTETAGMTMLSVLMYHLEQE